MAGHQRPQRIQNRYIECMLHFQRLTSAAALSEIFYHFGGLLFNMLYHHISAHAHLTQNFYREPALYIPVMTIAEHNTQSFAERANAIKKSVGTPIERIAGIELFDCFAAGHDDQPLAADAQTNNGTVCLVHVIPDQMVELVH